MIRHIVMWKFREGTEREQEQFLTGLRGLFGVIPQLRRCEAMVRLFRGIDIHHTALHGTQPVFSPVNDPRHKAVSALCKSIPTARVAGDYQI